MGSRFLVGMMVVGALVVGTGCIVDGGGGYATQTAAPTGTGPATLAIRNVSNESVMYIYMSPCSQTTWGPDLLGSNVLPRGSQFTLSNIQPGCWDLRCVDASGNYKEWRGQTFGAGGAYSLDLGPDGWYRD